MAAFPNIREVNEAIVASFVSLGVKVDGGGIVIVNGKPVPVDPWVIVRVLG